MTPVALLLLVASFLVQQHYVERGTTKLLTKRHDDNDMFLLSQSDVKRLDQLKSRQRTIPTIMMKQILLPGECKSFGSQELKFNAMVDAVESEGLAVLGSCSGATMAFGVTTRIQEISSASDGYTSIQILGDSVFEVVGTPFLDPTESFYYCHIDVVETDDEKSDTRSFQSDDRLSQTQQMHDQMPGLMELWSQRQKKTSMIDDQNNMPDSVRDRAFWVVATVCKDDATTRSSILADVKCDFDRTRLAWNALQEAIDRSPL